MPVSDIPQWIVDAFIKSKAGTVAETELVEVRRDGATWDIDQVVWYECPCGGPDHLAGRRWIALGYGKFLSDILNCPITRQQWLIGPSSVAAQILKEENRFWDMMKRGAKIVPKVVAKRGWSDETAEFLMDTYGIERDEAEMILEADHAD